MTGMAFARYYTTTSQLLPQCCKFLADEISFYLAYVDDNNVCDGDLYHTTDLRLQVNDEGFVQIQQTLVVFYMTNLLKSSPRDIEHYIDATRGNDLTEHQSRLLKLLACDRWYKGDFDRLHKILVKENVSDLIAFACNVMWERGYEDHYTLGQQLSVRITTKLIQSGLDFKHQNNNDKTSVGARGWENNLFEKLFASITSISDVIKRHKSSQKYIVIEIANDKSAALKRELKRQEFVCINNAYMDNVCAIRLDEDKNSLIYLQKLKHLISEKIINILFVTDVEFYLKQGNYLFYLYNSLKFYYYCLCNKFVFEYCDYEIIFLINLIVGLEWFNCGHLNSFTLEKSEIYNPLELSTRRLNSIKRAAAQSRILCNDNEIKIDFIKGKRIKTGSHYGHRLVEL
ncbi:P47 [Chrysodeixis chalcites nucleopolyhedrovirus]|uniref:p47 n=1 Tax=Chrysodeixis chalcites nucleopolyhedrovirus TaxID=320432 RepID=Q4KT47_9ABAC|nr:P47 [Chrysodeixis chalcites nucleopolyhedrovirus]AGC36248.1 P47 protein [Chrysodeixis chalcites SNPV TF1-A]AAY83964.1 P47 [Chrysodeixis chalcites nucleopolyhedrovirus]AGE61295.1 P47 protein [Chrysodeixis chalcites nucleopolyhedrovirus]AGE61444.1 P47 protein [Chrysodeixis chalcites nucleopolyhedrovirus]AGE61593.1 P47 protein [Chrysodeixis chalcites nucleopolyhedrovirus]